MITTAKAVFEQREESRKGEIPGGAYTMDIGGRRKSCMRESATAHSMTTMRTEATNGNIAQNIAKGFASRPEAAKGRTARTKFSAAGPTMIAAITRNPSETRITRPK